MRAHVTNVRKEFFFCKPEGAPTKRNEMFVAQDNCDFDIRELSQYDVVDIGLVITTQNGPRGERVRFVERANIERVDARIKHVNHEKGFALAVPMGSNGLSVMCHRTQFVDYRGGTGQGISDVFEELSVNDWVTCELLRTPEGGRGLNIARRAFTP